VGDCYDETSVAGCSAWVLRGVDRAVVTVEKALELYGRRSTSARKSCITSTWSARCKKRGAIFVDKTQEVPEGATVVFSAQVSRRSYTTKRARCS